MLLSRPRTLTRPRRSRSRLVAAAVLSAALAAGSTCAAGAATAASTGAPPAGAGAARVGAATTADSTQPSDSAEQPRPGSYQAQRAALNKNQTADRAELVAARPILRVPFRCGERWQGASRSGHSPSYWSLDLNWGSGTADLGKPVKTSAAGLVVRSAYDAGGYGNYIEVAHGDGWHTLYAHLRVRSVGVNARVTDSQQLGEVGATGNVTGPHLHYEQIKDGVVVAARFGQGTWAEYPGPATYSREQDC